MAHDDMHVLIYKMLAYLYDCLKKGTDPDPAVFEYGGLVFGAVPNSYRCAIIKQMMERGYVTGFTFPSGADNAVIAVDPEITLDGVEYMFENSMMKRAMKWLRDAKSALPFV